MMQRSANKESHAVSVCFRAVNDGTREQQETTLEVQINTV